jgi:hypothetical protein
MATNVIANQQEYQLAAANTPYLVLKATPKRVGLLICNANSSGIVYMVWGAPNAQIGIPLYPNEKRLMDVVTPTDALYMYAQNAMAVVIVEECCTL